MSRRKTIAVAIILIAIVAATCAVLYIFDPMTAGFYPRCPSKLLTGYDCPGCGSLRATHAVLHGDLVAAWHYNPAVFFAAALLGVIALAGIHRQPLIARYVPRRVRQLSQKMSRITDTPAFPAAILAATVLWTILRNI